MNDLNNSEGLRRMEKVKNALTSLRLRPVSRTINRKIGISEKNCLKLLAGYVAETRSTKTGG